MLLLYRTASTFKRQIENPGFPIPGLVERKKVSQNMFAIIVAYPTPNQNPRDGNPGVSVTAYIFGSGSALWE